MDLFEDPLPFMNSHNKNAKDSSGNNTAGNTSTPAFNMKNATKPQQTYMQMKKSLKEAEMRLQYLYRTEGLNPTSKRLRCGCNICGAESDE